MQGGIETIKPYVNEFVKFAKAHPEYTFLVTPIGCGIAGFTAEQISPLFAHAMDIKNILLPQEFAELINREYLRFCESFDYWSDLDEEWTREAKKETSR